MITTRTGIDHTDAMNRWAHRRVEELAREDLCGYVLKKDSPSCGMERVKIYTTRGTPARIGRGLFADVLIRRFPNLPVEEEGRLADPRLRENFIERIFAYRRLKNLFQPGWSVAALMNFDASAKMALLAHSTRRYHELRRLVAEARQMPKRELQKRYEALFMRALSSVPTIRSHANVLVHMSGHLTHVLDAESKRELRQSIGQYKRGLVPLVVPLTLIRHHVRFHRVASLIGQTYLDPDPRELMLRNHV
jgi:uncharacterized protein YbgA (DUF1722 family)